LEADVGKRVVKFTISNTGRLTQDQFYKLNRTKVLTVDDVDLEDVVDEDMVSEEVDDDNGLFKLVKRKKKKKIYLLIKTKGGLYLKFFKFDQPTQQPKSNSFVYVNTNRYSMLKNIIDNVVNAGYGSGSGEVDDSGSGSGSVVEEDSGSESGSGEVNESDSNSGSVSGGEEDFGTVPGSVNEEDYDRQDWAHEQELVHEDDEQFSEQGKKQNNEEEEEEEEEGKEEEEEEEVKI
jgi:hypothetical protein